MPPSVLCYPQPGKAKSRHLLEAFAAGAGGAVTAATSLQPGPAAFYGVVGLETLCAAARRRPDDYYYLDNSWFDAPRGRYFRVTRNALQRGTATPDRARWARLGIPIQPWRRAGRHVLVVCQSPHFMHHVAGWSLEGWQDWTLRRIRSSTTRPIVVRPWSRDKTERAATLQQDLADAWCVVAHASAAATEAVLAGVPVFVTTSDCAAAPMAGAGWNLERPAYPDDRETWAARLAARQWTVDELADGTAWSALHDIA